jgi:HAD superfamily hydrolase (TIGR01509 family)
MHAEAKDVKAQDAAQAASALVIEVEGVAADLRSVLFEVIRDILKREGAKLSELQFAKYCLHPNPAHFAAELLMGLGTKSISAEALADEVLRDFNERMTTSPPKLRDGFAKFVEAASAKGLLVAAVSALHADTQALVKNQPVWASGKAKLLCLKEVEKDFPRADVWLKAAKTLNVQPRRCVAVVSSTASCKSALAVGMRCIAVPDRFTSFQDFGGAHVVLESWEDMKPSEILEAVLL